MALPCNLSRLFLILYCCCYCCFQPRVKEYSLRFGEVTLGHTTCPGLSLQITKGLLSPLLLQVYPQFSRRKGIHTAPCFILFSQPVPPISSPKAHAAVYKMLLFRSPPQEAKGNLRLLSDNVLRMRLRIKNTFLFVRRKIDAATPTKRDQCPHHGPLLRKGGIQRQPALFTAGSSGWEPGLP